MLEARRVPSIDPARPGKFDRVVLYTIDGGPAHLTRLPDETFTEDRLREHLKREVAERSALRGRSFTV